MNKTTHRTYLSLLRSTCKKLEVLQKAHGLNLEPRFVFGLIGFEMQTGLWKTTGQPVSALKALLDGKFRELEDEFHWLTLEELKKTLTTGAGTQIDRVRSEGQQFKKIVEKHMVVQSDFAEIANINSGKSVRKKRTETFIDIKQIEVVEKSFIPDRQMLYLRTKKQIARSSPGLLQQHIYDRSTCWVCEHLKL